MPYIYSGVCLAAMFASIVYEHRRLKKEENKLRETLKDLAEQTQVDFGQTRKFGAKPALQLAS